MTDSIAMPRIVHTQPAWEEVRNEFGIYFLALKDWGAEFDNRYEVVALDEDRKEIPRLHPCQCPETRPYLQTIKKAAMVVITYCVQNPTACQSSLLTWEYE